MPDKAERVPPPQVTRNGDIRPTRLWFFVLVPLVLGIFFRFVNLDRQVYWGDEIFTSLRIAGHTVTEIEGDVGDGRPVSIETLHAYQYPAPHKSAADTVKGLASEEPQHVPLYFLVARLWVEQFGNSIAVTRSLSAFISLLTFPCLYWLCRELFESPTVKWVALALVAVSPVHVVYAQEARPYSLYIVVVLLSSAALLRAIRVDTIASWSVYACTVALGLYTQLLFGLVVIWHGVYVALVGSSSPNSTRRRGRRSRPAPAKTAVAPQRTRSRLLR